MAIFGSTLSAGMRASLASMADLTSSMDVSNERLATGKRINSALDGAANYFQSQGLADRAKGFNTARDSIAMGLQTISTATKGLDQIKTLIDGAIGQLKTAQSSTGTNAKASSALSFSAGTDLMATATGTATQFDVGDAIHISTYNGAGGAGATGTLTITLSATVTVQYVIDQINGNATLNPAGAPRVRASLSNGTSGSLVIEQVETNTSTTQASGAGNAVGLQINLTNTGTAQNLQSVFNFTGISTGAIDATSTTASVRAFGTTNTARLNAYNNLATTLTQISQLANDANFNGTNLLKGDALSTTFNVDGTSTLRTQGSAISNTFLGMNVDYLKNGVATGATFDPSTTAGSRNMQSDTEIKNALAGLSAATTAVTNLSSQLSANTTIMKARDTFTKDYVNLLDEGADLLVAADMNQEGANLLALQTRQTLSVQALSMASRSDQAILRLF